MAQRLKRLPSMRETWVRSLGWEEPLEKEMVTYSICIFHVSVVSCFGVAMIFFYKQDSRFQSPQRSINSVHNLKRSHVAGGLQ